MRDLNVDQIKKLWILDLIVQSGSLKKAALRAKVSPSAISQCLSSLEHAVGKPLLVRDRGTISPTSEAIAILDTVRPAFEAFDRLRDLNGAPIPKLSWLNFGTYESIAIDVIPGLLQSLRDKMPGIRLKLRISRTATLLSMVRKGELCSALITEIDDLNRLYVKKVAEDRLGFYVSQKHPIKQLGWKAVEKYGIGSLTPGKDGLPRYFTKYLKQYEVPNPVMQSDSFEVLRTAAAAGSIVAVLPQRVANRSGDLLEVAPSYNNKKVEKGRHGLFIVSQSNCDPEEADFLAIEIARLLDLERQK